MTRSLQAVRGKNPPGIVRGLLSPKILVIAAIATQTVLPSGRTAAQTRAERGGHSINAAIEEVRHGPFHSRVGVERPAAIRPGGRHPAHSLHTYRPTPSEEETPDVWSALALTLPAVMVADFAAVWLFFRSAFDGDGDPMALLGALTIPVLAPAASLNLSGVPFGHGVTGSAVGMVAALVLTVAAIQPEMEWTLLFPPVIHAAVATWFSMRNAGL